MTIVSIVKGEDIEKMLHQAINLIGGANRIISHDKRVLIKVNMTASKPFSKYPGVTTRPEVLRATIRELKKLKPKEIAVGESAGVIATTQGAYKKTGLGTVAEEEGVEAICFEENGLIEVFPDDPVYFEALRFYKTILDYDVIVNLPVLKTTHACGITGSMKNMFAVIPNSERWSIFHRLFRVEDVIVDINNVKKPDLTIMDGTVGQEGLAGGAKFDRPVYANLMIASFDPVAIDSVSAKIMGLDPEKILHLRWAAAKGIGVYDLRKITIRGLPVEKAQKKFMHPIEEVNLLRKKIRIVESGACSGCWAPIVSAFGLKNQGPSDDQLKDRIDIYIGPNVKYKEGKMNIIVGKCLHCLRDKGIYIPKCPLDGEAITFKDLEKAVSELLGHEVTFPTLRYEEEGGTERSRRLVTVQGKGWPTAGEKEELWLSG